jgi:hypothetical protein
MIRTFQVQRGEVNTHSGGIIAYDTKDATHRRVPW